MREQGQGEVHMQSAKGVAGGDGSRPNAAVQFEEGDTAKFVPVTVRRWGKAINVCLRAINMAGRKRTVGEPNGTALGAREANAG